MDSSSMPMSGSRRRVCVIGAGISGLSTALNIVQLNDTIDVTIITDRCSPDTTSDVAGGIWMPLTGKANRSWTMATRDHLQYLMTSGRGMEAGVQHMGGIDIASYTPQMPGVGDADEQSGYLIQKCLTEDETKTLFPHQSHQSRQAAFILTFLVNTTIYLAWLRQQFLQSERGSIIRRQINSLSELAGTYDVIVNCSGLGARELAGDKSVHPDRGQIVLVKAPHVKTYYHDTVSNDVGVFPYILPRKDDVVLGGAHGPGDSNTHIDPKLRENIINTVCQIMPSLRNAEIIGERVGLRPARDGGPRVEKEIINVGGVAMKVVHNYGHGGQGVMLHWGCARDASQLVQQLLYPSRL